MLFRILLLKRIIIKFAKKNAENIPDVMRVLKRKSIYYIYLFIYNNIYNYTVGNKYLQKNSVT